ncbi:low molecular weight phosphatase family protein [Rathayibacter sp. YIM 133350]|uniref:arsenate reductase/protein-tyrosine-phosphatase family protein n=1 Tax=Rathayibacter sp. YIM 133350 TaxID=3131992 RepID=UPI00307E01B8
MAWSGYQGAPLRVLTVCTGNVCRSPLAERLLEVRLAAAGVPAVVASAGTGALVGEDMTEPTAELVARYGGAQRPQRARQLTVAMLENADLVLTASRSHRAEAVSELPRANRYAFTLREFARLAETARAENDFEIEDLASPAALVRAVGSYRGYLPPLASPDDDDVIDPYRRPQEFYDETGRVLDDATRVIASVLGKPRADG